MLTKLDKAALGITSVLGVGFLPFAPGTFGSLVGLALSMHLRTTTHFSLFTWILALGFTLGALPLIRRVLLNPRAMSARQQPVDATRVPLSLSKASKKDFDALNPRAMSTRQQPVDATRVPLSLSKASKKDFDPSYIVIDEVVGQLVTMGCLAWFWGPLKLVHFGLGFFFFRVFDILKPWPLHAIELSLGKRKATQPLGIMLDDILAGIFAGCLPPLFWLVYTAFVSGV